MRQAINNLEATNDSQQQLVQSCHEGMEHAHSVSEGIAMERCSNSRNLQRNTMTVRHAAIGKLKLFCN